MSTIEQKRQWQKDYYNRHKEKLTERRKSHTINKELKKISDAKHYAKNREKRNQQMMDRYWNNKSLVDAISLHYGCQSKVCCWTGKFLACQLDFHHFSPEDKVKEVRLIVSNGLKAIAAEINKCVVLCRCCHALLHNGIDIGISTESICVVNEQLDIIEKLKGRGI
jgi:hypothetical protein